MLAEFERAAGQVSYRTPDLLFVSNLSGEPAMAEVASAGYWVRQAREPVKFAAGIESLFRRDCNVFVEIGPARTLLGLGRRSAPEDDQALWLPSLQREGGDWEPLLGSLGQLYARGFPVDWRGFDRDYRRVRPALPTYPWQRESHWRPAAAHPGLPAVSAEPGSAAWRAFGQGDAASLLKQLAESGEFSAEELKLAPRLLEALAQPRRPEHVELADPELLYEVAWRPQAAAVPPSAPDFWPAPGELAARMRPRLSELAPADADAAYRRVLARLEELCIDYVAEAWEQLGWTFRAGSRCRRAELAECLGVVERHRRFLERTAEMLAEAGLLRADGDGWEAAAPFTSARPGERIGGLLAECPAAAAELILLDRCAGRLADVLSGRQDPLLLLFPEDDAVSASSLYRDSPGARLMNRVLHEAAALAVKQLPAGRRLRVLEIGAGTGGTTAGLLDLLPAGQTDYLFTDISPRFTTAAREQFGRYRFVRYRLLDIERDPATQDFAGEAPFDLIIAANVLHATRDLRQTLRNVRQLAAPGALLLLLEGTAPIRTIDLVFGLTEGWWRFAGDGVRARHPLLSSAEWARVLNPCGFPEAEALALAGEPGEVLAKQAVMVARAGQGAIPESALTFRHWLILADRGGIGERLASRHGERGGASTLVYPGPAFERLGDDAFRIAPDRPEDFRRLLAALDPGRDHDVVHLWSLDEPAMDAAPDLLSRIAESRLSCGSVVNLVRAVAEGASGLPVRNTWLVTRGAVGGAPFRGVPGLAQAGLWGLARVAAREHPELGTVRLDLDPEASAEDCARLLWDELSAPPDEDEVAFRTGARYVSRLVRHVAAEAARPVEFRDDASYLITGGLGGLGILTARWMAGRGAKNLVLVGRRPADQRAERACRELEAMGARVLVCQADVAQYPEMQRVLAEAAASLPPLRGIIHGAGVLDDGMLRQLTFERLDRVIRPKVVGAWNLHCLTHGTELDFFVLYSSFTAVLGTPGQANHAAANAFLDALAWHRRGLGLPALSLDWGAWSEIGAAAKRRVDERLEAKGGGALSPAQGLRLLEATWRAEAAQIAAVPIYWTQLDEPLARRPLFAELAPTPGAATNRPADFLERFRAASRPRRRALLAGHVLAETAKVLGLKGADAIQPSQGFFALGMDSLTSVELRNRLRTSLQCELPTTVAFDHPDPDALADFLLGRIDPPEDAPAPAVAAALPAEPAARGWEVADLDRLPVAELENLIDELAGTA